MSDVNKSGNIEDLSIFKAVNLKIDDPEKVALRFVNEDGTEEPVSYQNLFEQTNRTAHALLKAGIGKGDTFTMLMKNHPEFIYALFAAVSIGAVAVPIDPRSRGRKLAFQIKNTKSKGILVADQFMESLEEIKADISDVPVVGVLYKAHHKVPENSAYPVLNELLETGNTDIPDKALPFDAGASAQIIHTSGTTGDPKGVVLKADRFLIYSFMADFLWQYQSDDIPYTGLSLTHGNAQSVTLMPSLAKKLPAVISERFTKSNIWDICRKYGCTTFSLLGGMMAGIYNEPPRPDDADNPVRKVISAGTPRAIWEDFEKRFGVKIHEWYAAVEGGLAHNPPGSGPVGSFGKPPQGLVEMKVVDENDNDVPPGARGELISRMVNGPTEVNYYGKADASKEKTRGGWLRSGDICHQDEDGFFYFDFRKGGGLRRQGDFVQPDLIEKIIGEHESVSEVCVYGVPAASGAPGESDIVAAMAPFAGRTVDVEGVKQTCLAELERNSVPTYFQIVDEIPKTISEKMLSRVLEEQFDPNAPNVIRV
ncbi:AMP-binding protein [Desulfosudis oleivorans]|uniref:AMP-dependent synthetase and ligase n=1 Tax=Desulfosudis oleivorans (strain DSM 6200 / JCM 39069 / Hxd3) TaxID=96561 RepID=A8ZZC4_DESOH|nr:AMP-binding protein [Desulfosudis oleivorans]ABW67277.1 AMP-dependent synthetase and ligase [Desulfosudis oleivorans Hxd3]